MKKRRAIFFDRDGIVNKRLVGDYVKTVDEFEFLPDFFPLFELTNRYGLLKIVVSNQQGVGKAIMTLKDLRSVTQFMQIELVSMFGFGFDDVEYCTELASAHSYRRKPEPGMILDAARKWNIDIEQSWMIGDSISDATAGKQAGCSTILVGDFTKAQAPDADWIVEDLVECYDLLNSFLQKQAE